ncbi:MAG: hypothetical protein KDD22_09150, partial [Bdellovibrionales bacterium]|nr:hypothetical protein [Bdellovibrionales bacterium]
MITKSAVGMILPVIAAFAVLGCTNTSDSSGDGVGGIAIPSFQKLSDSDFADFLETVDQVSVVRRTTGVGIGRTGLMDAVVQEILAHKDRPTATNNANKSELADYQERWTTSF